MRKQSPMECPVCGEDVPAGALACPECGADHETGWREDAESESVDLPDQNFDYDDFVKREFGRSPKPTGIKPLWWCVAILLVVILLVSYFRR